MAKKAKTTSTRVHRSPAERIEALQRQIENLKQREQAKALKDSPAAQQAILIVRALNKGLSVAEEEQDIALKRSLADAHENVAAYLETQGMKVPKARKPRGRKPKR
ncbi:MAG: hypothetical protein WD226_05020 [Planctomycetota bacterium]